MLITSHWLGVAKSTLAAIEKGCGGDTYAARFHFCLGYRRERLARLGDTGDTLENRSNNGCVESMQA